MERRPVLVRQQEALGDMPAVERRQREEVEEEQDEIGTDDEAELPWSSRLPAVSTCCHSRIVQWTSAVAVPSTTFIAGPAIATRICAVFAHLPLARDPLTAASARACPSRSRRGHRRRRRRLLPADQRQGAACRSGRRARADSASRDPGGAACRRRKQVRHHRVSELVDRDGRPGAPGRGSGPSECQWGDRFMGRVLALDYGRAISGCGDVQ